MADSVCTIDDLPDEILDLIAEHLSGRCAWLPGKSLFFVVERQNMQSASVCRRWRRVFGAPRFREPCQNAYSLFKTVKIVCLEDAWLGASGERLVKYST